MVANLAPASVAGHCVGHHKVLAPAHQVELEHLVERVGCRKGKSLVAIIGLAAKHLVKERLRAGMTGDLKVKLTLELSKLLVLTLAAAAQAKIAEIFIVK